jgi:GMP synthase (glutamine-hydrolysing)
LIVKTGATLPEIAERHGDFENWIESGLGYSNDTTSDNAAGPATEKVDVVSIYEGEDLPEADTISGVVITGSSALVTEREAWSERCAGWLPQVVEREIPVLGICYGHQLLAHALGGRVDRNPLGREIGTVEVRFDEGISSDSLLGGLSQQISVQVSHVESVVALPTEAVHLGASAGDPNQAFAYGPCAWGVQFHPEFDAEIVRGYIKARRSLLLEEGLDPDAISHNTRDTDHGTRVLRRFGEIVRSRAQG